MQPNPSIERTSGRRPSCQPLAAMSTAAFRCLLLACFALQIGASFIDVLFPSLIPSAFSRAIEAEPLPLAFREPLLVIVVASWGAVVLGAAVGLFFLRHWARGPALGATVFGLALSPLFGVAVSSSVASAFTEASSVLWGAVLAAAYFSPLREHFAPANNGG